jgi:predicted nucleotidyltransferase
MNAVIANNIDKILELSQKHKVEKLYAFGSVLTDRFGKNSDIDFIVKFGDIDLLEYADNYFEMKNSLQNIFKRPVDLLEEQAIRNPILRCSIDKNKQIIYGRES